MAILGPRQGSKTSSADSFFGVDISPGALRVNAIDVAGRLGDYAKRAAPERPAALELGDEALREAARKSERGGRLNKAESDALALFATWRAAVFRVEEEMRGNLMVLLGALNRLEGLGDGDTGAGAATEIRAFLLASYRAPVPDPAPWACSVWAEKWSARYAQQRDVLPLGLRLLTSVSAKKRASEEVQEDQATEETW